MDRTIRISGGLYACFLALFLEVAHVLYLPGLLVQHARQEAWLSVVLNGLVIAPVGLLICWAGNRFARRSPGQAARAALGKGAGSLVALFHAGFMIWIFSLVVRNVQDFSAMILLPGTPGLLLAALLASVSLYAVWSGLEPLARVAFQALAASVLAVMVMPPLLVRELSVLHLEPFLARGAMPVVKASLLSLDWNGEIVAFFAIVPYLSRPRDGYRWTLIGVTGATMLLAAMVGLTVGVLGPVLPARLTFPVYSMLQMVSLAQFIERIEVIFVVVWLSGMFVKAGILLYASAEAVTDGLGLRSHRWPAAALAATGVGLAQIWPGAIDLVQWGSSPLHTVLHLGAEGVILLAFVSVALLLSRQSGVRQHA